MLVAGLVEGIQVFPIHFTTLAYHRKSKGAQGLQPVVGERRLVPQGVGDVVRHLHHLGDSGVGGHTVVAGMLHVDGLPDHRFLILVEAAVQHQLVQLLVSLQYTGRLCHDAMQTRDHAEDFDGVLQQGLGRRRG